MVAGELLYCGAARTPVMAFGPTLPFRGAHVPLMMEYFATTADVHRLTGELPDRADLHPAADGGAKTREASRRRLPVDQCRVGFRTAANRRDWHA